MDEDEGRLGITARLCQLVCTFTIIPNHKGWRRR
jgi:hypothetical protein